MKLVKKVRFKRFSFDNREEKINQTINGYNSSGYGVKDVVALEKGHKTQRFMFLLVDGGE